MRWAASALALDLLLQISLARRRRSASSWRRAPALGRVLLELAGRPAATSCASRIELFPHARDAARCSSISVLLCLGLLADLRLGRRRSAGAAASELLSSRSGLLELLDVGGPVGEPLLDRALGARASCSPSLAVASRSRSATSRRRSSAIRRSSSASPRGVGAQAAACARAPLRALGDLVRRPRRRTRSCRARSPRRGCGTSCGRARACGAGEPAAREGDDCCDDGDGGGGHALNVVNAGARATSAAPSRMFAHGSMRSARSIGPTLDGRRAGARAGRTGVESVRWTTIISVA